jgi:mono/diheme cytochrome c family protein
MLALTLDPIRSRALYLALLLGACADVGLAGPMADNHAVDEGNAEADPDDDGTASDPVDEAVLPRCDVAAILKAKCQSCHGSEPLFGAPMPLVEQADFFTEAPVAGQRVLDVVARRIHDETSPMPPRNAAQLTPEELATLDAWIASGAPAATEGCDGVEEPSDDPRLAPWPDDCEEMHRLVAHDPNDITKPLMVKAGEETHPQVIWDAPWGDDEVQIVGVRPITDNAKVLHHWILYENTGSAAEAAFIVGWAPGNTDAEHPLPKDVGIYVPSGPESLRLDMHYHNKTGTADEPDMSGVEVCVTRQLRPNTATVFNEFTNILGLILLPTGIPTEIVGSCKISADVPIHILGVNPHMHTLGRHARMEVTRKNGSVEVWHDGPFDFYHQTIYPLDKLLHDGDTVKTVCTFVNDSGNLVTFGENTGSEMCFNFTSYYPMGHMSCAAF